MDPVAATERAVGRPLEPTLVERARHGDVAAFEILLRGRLDPLFRTAWAILGSEADARDATQEACISAWRQLPRLRDADAFDAWLHRVLVNCCRMALRRRGRVREVPIGASHDQAANDNDGVSSLEESEAILRAFDRLSIDQRTILTLHHLQHQPLATISLALGIPIGTAKSRLHAARAALERALAEEWR